MKTRPATTVGCPYIDEPPGNPNAHFSLSRDAWLAGIPAALADWYRAFVASTPQPFQAGAAVRLVIGGLPLHAFGIFAASPMPGAMKLRPERYSAMACLSASGRAPPCI